MCNSTRIAVDKKHAIGRSTSQIPESSRRLESEELEHLEDEAVEVAIPNLPIVEGLSSKSLAAGDVVQQNLSNEVGEQPSAMNSNLRRGKFI